MPYNRCNMEQIHLEYIDAVFSIKFEHSFSFFTAPPFIFRSILGSQLHSIACIARQNTCRTCQFNRSCVYAIIFETILDKDTPFLVGRDKGSHPFRIKTDPPFKIRTPVTELMVTIQLYGFAVQYLPYIFYALQKAGEQGLFKEKAQYTIQSVHVNHKNVLLESKNIDTVFTPCRWDYDDLDTCREIRKRIVLNSPLRFKTGGRYTVAFTAQEFLLCIHRRLATLCSLYGTYTPHTVYTPSEDIRIKQRNLSWLDYQYHSHRQDRIIKMGGVTGSFLLHGTLTGYEQRLLDFAGIFGGGKNNNFGLGDITIGETR